VLIVVDIFQRSIHYYDSCHAGTDEQLPRLQNIELFMDDFETKKRSLKKNFKWSLHLNDCETPRQINTYDCGVFICLFCYLISKHQPVKFDQSIIPSFQSHMAILIVECKTYEINHLRHQDTIKKVPSGFYFEMFHANQTIMMSLLQS
jgi:sentrin-specific protease 1